jgi:20S proteasome alpha/beta subunit
MDFPRTWIDESRDRFKGFEGSMDALGSSTRNAAAGQQNFVSTGTTVVAFMTQDKKRGIIASDGRVSMGNYSMDEGFQKVYNCRIGFVGFAGTLMLAQELMPVFRSDLNAICDSRGRPITASGASRRLFGYYLSAQKIGALDLIPLFWDFKEERCYLYLMMGGSFLSRDRSAGIGSGSVLTAVSVENAKPTNSLRVLLNYARRTLCGASSKDTATNKKMFCGIIDNGDFREREEVL